MNKQLSVFFLSSIILLSGCSAGELSTTNDDQFDQKLNNITGQTKKLMNNTKQKEPKKVENVKTSFWPTNPQFKMKSATVTKVNDDGTVEINQNEKVKLLGVRTTEEEKHTRTYQKMTPHKAEAFIKKNLLYKKVYLEINPTFETNDKGETLAYIWIGDNKELKNFNALLLKEGLGVTER
ncbi:thermonuclease family protein [Bacillus sp. FSL W8-0116]|uniref:thermonuclease family protein n=1 Tax=Bacillus sp. FSL W8-0116 TaxID=2978206 RepID=UPI0030F609DA